ncbi:Mut7-C RNAse domain-containing protein [Halorientalis litorea]|uniref:Mut7-C RNAse domain-containing protein n=1 Tax=Halorientalis litorea TaxID=2931977 RepID=UPI002111243C|nr:Mut7-C RNAse domain-containing protein [Halorientalis litorea]
MTDECPTGGDERARDALLLDAMLGKLATYLRMCGYDAAYALDRDAEDDDRLLAIARDEDRTVLTRDRDVARRADDAVLLTTRDVTDQLRELREAGYPLALADRPTRCGRCNGPVERVDADDGTPEYAPDPAEVSVWQCLDCGQHFWQGSHWDEVAERLAGL